MTKEDFETTDEPLGIIVSLDPESGKVLYDTYDWRTVDSWMNEFKDDFSDYIHFMKLNPAAIKERKKMFGLTPSES